MRGWLLSTGHCKNLIDERFTEFGIARVQSNNPLDPYGSYWVMVAGRRTPRNNRRNKPALRNQQTGISGRESTALNPRP